MNPLGIYIHIPYCLHKCGYCDFNSHKINVREMEAYKNALLLEIDFYAQKIYAEGEVVSIFLGGGTPTTFPVPYLEEVLERVRAGFKLSEDCEISIEANPATVERGTFEGIRAAGYNRLSVGVQSFDGEELKALDRIHGVEEIHRTVEAARQAGFDNLNIDLMFAIPGQTPASWENNLKEALAKNPEHLSTYNLSIEPETSFYDLQASGKLVMPPDDFQLDLYKHTIDTLESAGYRHYEISNFAKPGKECRHNLLYWENAETLGLGAGASSHIDGSRYKNYAPPERYILEVERSGQAAEEYERLEPRRAIEENIMLGLRLRKGFDIGTLEERFQFSFQDMYGKTLSTLLDQNMITLDHNRLALSRRGLFLADSVILEFFTSEPPGAIG